MNYSPYSTSSSSSSTSSTGATHVAQQQQQHYPTVDPYMQRMESTSYALEAAHTEPFSVLVDFPDDDAYFLGLDAHSSALELQSLGFGLDATTIEPTTTQYSIDSTSLLASSILDTDDADGYAHHKHDDDDAWPLPPLTLSAHPVVHTSVSDAGDPPSPSPSSPPAAAAAHTSRKRKGASNSNITSSSSTSTTSYSLLPSSAAAAVDLTTSRKQRHNANERRRTNALKTRLVDMRNELDALEAQRTLLQTQRSPLPLSATTRHDALSSMSNAFQALVATIDRLRHEHAMLLQQLQRWDLQGSTFQTLVTEFRVAGAPAAPAAPADAAASCDENDAAPIFQRVLFGTLMPLHDALACVRESYNEIVHFQAKKQFDSLGGDVFGWRDRRVLDADSLQFMFAQTFEFVLPNELVYKTWRLLTTRVLYTRIQPLTTALEILQVVTDDCVIARLSVGRGATQHHTLLLIARGRIDNGFLITYRSIPLTKAQQQFADTEGTYVNIFNWFMFLEQPHGSGNSATGGTSGSTACEVIFGGKVKNQSAAYLRYLMMEVVAGVVRWQTAVGLSKFRLTH